MIPGLDSHAAWKDCITVKCGIPLTPAYVAERIQVLADPRNEQTRRFVETWGDAHRQDVLGWFRQAQADLAGGRAP